MKRALKEKILEKPKRQKAPRSKVARSTPDEAPTKKFWAEEVETLKGSHFKSIDDAMKAVVDCVVVKMRVPKSQQNEVSEFLLELFAQDPSLKDQLRNLLKL